MTRNFDSACADRVCIVDVAGGVQGDGRVYCDDACADHHRNGAGRHHAGCTCRG